MSNQLYALLSEWFEKKDETEWALGTIIKVEGSSYRKPGAMMLVNAYGQSFGMLSGGCLEGEIKLQARRVWLENTTLIKTYDFSQEDDDWKSSLGCGGVITVAIQVISKSNKYQQLDLLYECLKKRESVYYFQSFFDAKGDILNLSGSKLDKNSRLGFNLANVAKHNCVFGNVDSLQSELFINTSEFPCLFDCAFIHKILPAPKVMIMGGGPDTIPLVQIITTLGWEVQICDPRTQYAKASEFGEQHTVLRHQFDDASLQSLLKSASAVVIMTHNIQMDGDALLAVKNLPLAYLGMLGPKHRTEKVLNAVSIKHEDVHSQLHNPVGLDIGGETPESIALSIVAHIHQVLFGKYSD